jgi:hypothetical protein
MGVGNELAAGLRRALVRFAEPLGDELSRLLGTSRREAL